MRQKPEIHLNYKSQDQDHIKDYGFGLLLCEISDEFHDMPFAIDTCANLLFVSVTPCGLPSNANAPQTQPFAF